MHRKPPISPWRRALAVLGTLAALAAPRPAAAQIPPDERWMVFDTEHFRVHYTQGLEGWGRRLAARAEAARRELQAALVEPPAGKVNLVISDNVDFANGFASVFPRNRVVVFAHPPVDDPFLVNYDDWLDVVITHELVHIWHLDYASGLWKNLRQVFGRAPLTFPNILVPDWTTEGLATYLESRLTPAGRIRGTMHEMVLRTAVLEDRFFTLDRATGTPTRWPGGNTRYVYGSMFMDYLARRHGHEGAGRLVRTVGGRIIPYFLNSAARRAYGVTFSQAWREWRDSLTTRYGALADSLRGAGLTEPQVLTPQGRRTEFPRWSPDGRWIAFAQATGREEASTRLVGAEGGEVRVVAPRTSLGITAWMPDGRSLVTAELDAADPYRYYSDLYRVALDGGRDRTTKSARLLDPDVARDGRVVAVHDTAGTNVPVVIDRPGAAPRPLAAPDPDVHWAGPRWSPGGDRIAVQRKGREGHDVVVLDAAGRVARQLTRDRAVDQAPAWSPDGRYVVFSSDRTGIPNLYAYDLQADRLLQVTSVLTGAFQPDVSPDGRWIALAYYRADGWHVARVPFDPSTWRPAPPLRAEAAGLPTDPPPPDSAGGPARQYSALPSLLPTAWAPISLDADELGPALGASTGGQDVVERHEWAALAQVYTETGRFDAAVGYIFRGLGVPVLGGSFLQDWDVAIRQVDSGGRPVNALLERERSLSAVATWPRPRFRSFSWISAGVNLRDREQALSNPDVPGIELRDLPAEAGAMVTAGISTARGYEFSISAEDGWVAALSAEGRRYLSAPEGPDDAVRGYFRLTGRGQGYRGLRLGGFARHALAGRVAGGADFGSLSPGYSVGGTGGIATAFPLSTGTGLDSELDFPARGYDEGAQAGDRAAAATLEYRFPLSLVERGLGVYPLWLDRLWGALFADGATAWCVEACEPALGLNDAPDPLFSVGAELGIDFSFGYFAPIGLRAGVALPLSDVETDPGVFRRPEVKGYLVVGRSF